MPHINTITKTIPEQAQTYQVFSQAITRAIKASNEAKELKASNADKKLLVKKLIKIIVPIIKEFKIYTTRLTKDKVFLPYIEEFIFSFISEQLHELKTVVGKNYSGLLGSDRSKDEILKIEIYLNDQIMQLQDYQRSLQLTDKTRSFITEWQKTPLKKIDWNGLQRYKTELTTIQEEFKTYKIHLNPEQWLKPLSEFSDKLNLITPGTPLAIVETAPKPVASTSRDELELKDIYALERILNYIDLAIAIDLDKNPLGSTIIERALQVSGEYFKSSKESTHLSAHAEQKLKNLGVPIKHIEKLRNSLSHSGSFIFSIREKIKQNANSIDFFKRAQRDLKKIKKVVIKVLYRVNLKKTKSQIADIASTNSNTEIQPLLAKITSSEDLHEIALTLDEILIKITSLNLSETEKKAIKLLQIKGILANLNLNRVDETIRGLEALDLNEPDLETKLINLNEQLESKQNAELNFFKNNHISPSKSTITALSETSGLENFPIDTQKINLPRSNLALFDLLVKKTFKQYSILYSDLLSGPRGLGKDVDFDESLLNIDIDDFARRHKLSLTANEKQELIDNFKLFNHIEDRRIKSKFLKHLEKIDYVPIEESALQEIAKTANLNEKQKELLKANLLELHQELFFNQFFENYLDTLLAEIKDKISAPEFNTLKTEINQEKELHRTIGNLLDYTNNLSDMKQSDYEISVKDITPKLVSSALRPTRTYWQVIQTSPGLRQYLKRHNIRIKTYSMVLKNKKQSLIL